MNLFVSYTRPDEALVRSLRDDLERLGRTVWMDHQIHGGESWWREIIQEILQARVFVFALSNDSWRSQPCRLELQWAEQLGIPILPVQVGPLDSMRIPLAERQIIDYRGRNADAVLALAAALTELSAHNVDLPDPLPPPPQVPFEYLYRIASVMGPSKISPDGQEELIAKLRRKLKEEQDGVARADIVKLLHELRDRPELTIQNAAEIDDILAGTEASKIHAPDDGATRLPPADHWRREIISGSVVPVIPPEPPQSSPQQEEPAAAALESPAAHQWQPVATAPPAAEPEPAQPDPPRSQPAQPDSPRSQPAQPDPPRSEPAQPDSPRSQRAQPDPPRSEPAHPETPRSAPPPTEPPSPGPESSTGESVPAWLRGMVQNSGQWPKLPPGPATPEPATARWWNEQLQPVAPPPLPLPPHARPRRRSAAPSPAAVSTRFAFVGALLGAAGIPFLLLAYAVDDSKPAKLTIIVPLLVAVLGLSISIVSATRREPRSRIAVVLAVIGLTGVLSFAAATGFFD